MRKEVLKLKIETKHYKQLYRNECVKNDKLGVELVKMRKKNAELQSKLNDFNMRNKKEKEEHSEKVTRKRKEWHSIKNDCTKRRRFAHYKDMIFSKLKEIEICHRAEITIWVYDNKFHYSWAPNDFSI